MRRASGAGVIETRLLQPDHGQNGVEQSVGKLQVTVIQWASNGRHIYQWALNVLVERPGYSAVVIPFAVCVLLLTRDVVGAGTMGLKGDLTAGEIVEQLLHAQRVTRIKNVVFMVCCHLLPLRPMITWISCRMRNQINPHCGMQSSLVQERGVGGLILHLPRCELHARNVEGPLLLWQQGWGELVSGSEARLSSWGAEGRRTLLGLEGYRAQGDYVDDFCRAWGSRSTITRRCGRPQA